LLTWLDAVEFCLGAGLVRGDKLGFTTDQEEPEALLYRSGSDRLFLLFSSPGAGTARHQLAAWAVEDLEGPAAPGGA
jgi:hypothetical protein